MHELIIELRERWLRFNDELEAGVAPGVMDSSEFDQIAGRMKELTYVLKRLKEIEGSSR